MIGSLPDDMSRHCSMDTEYGTPGGDNIDAMSVDPPDSGFTASDGGSEHLVERRLMDEVDWDSDSRSSTPLFFE